MKKVLLLIILPFSFFYAKAQDYQPMVIENAHWVVSAFSVSTNEGDPHSFVLRGDTVVNGMTYKKVFHRQLGDFSPPYSILNETLFGVIREDLQTQKIYTLLFENYDWGYFCSINEESLLYDFSMEVGDSATVCLVSEANYWVTDSVGTEFIWGEEREVFIENDDLFSKLIEGIGTTEGPFSFPDYLTSTGTISLSLHDYCVGTEEDCGFILVGNKEVIQNSDIILSPNPVSSFLNIEFLGENTLDGHFKILDLIGQEVATFPIEQNEVTMVVPVWEWAKGVYFLQLVVENQVVTTEKFVIK